MKFILQLLLILFAATVAAVLMFADPYLFAFRQRAGRNASAGRLPYLMAACCLLCAGKLALAIIVLFSGMLI
jgi:hypothetical protein